MLQNEIIQLVEKQKVDFIHFVDIAHLSEEQNKGYQNAILIGMVLSKEYMSKVINTENYVKKMVSNDDIQTDEFYLKEIEIDNIADTIAGFIQSKGYSAYSQSEKNIIKTGFFDAESKSTPLPHKTIALLAGLGWIGKHNLLVTKKFGSAICMCTVLTDTPLETRNYYPLESLCGDCKVCKDVCSTAAIIGNTWRYGINREKLINVNLCDTCLKCMVVCPWTQDYVGK